MLDLQNNSHHKSMSRDGPRGVRSLPISTIHYITPESIGNRVADVVRELIENSIDAKATTIRVTLGNGGYSLISVSDNGVGIDQHSIPLVCRYYATSKMTDITDFQRTNSLGFRGISLAEISCMSHITITTRTSHDELATVAQYSLNVMLKRSTKPQIPFGTTVDVEDFLFNYPEIRGQRGNTEAEIGKTLHMITKYAVMYPAIIFRVIVNGKDRLKVGGSGTMNNVIKSVYGESVMLSESECDIDRLRAKICIARPKPGIKKEAKAVFVNGRLVSCPEMKKEIVHLMGLSRLSQKAVAKMKTCYFLMITCPREIGLIKTMFAKRHITFPNKSAYTKALGKAIVNDITITRQEDGGRIGSTQPVEESSAPKPKHDAVPQSPRKKKPTAQKPVTEQRGPAPPPPPPPPPQVSARQPNLMQPTNQMQATPAIGNTQRPMHPVSHMQQIPLLQTFPPNLGDYMPSTSVQLTTPQPHSSILMHQLMTNSINPIMMNVNQMQVPMYVQMTPLPQQFGAQTHGSYPETGKDMCDMESGRGMKRGQKTGPDSADDKGHQRKTRGQKK